jgi:transglutaminase-like putative cysteine protease
MRLSIVHETAYRYQTPASRVIEILRLTPRGHDGQYVVSWRIDVDRDCRLDLTTDPFGNSMHTFTVEGPLDGLVITAEAKSRRRTIEASFPVRSNAFLPPCFSATPA